MKHRSLTLWLLGLSLLLGLAAWGMRPEERAFFGRGPEVIAHRAGAAHAPENTLAALEQAIAAGADGAEIDVRQTGDGTLIVLHDDSFYRTAGLDRKVWELDCRSAKDLDAGDWYSHQFQGECVPTLEEMLEAARGRIRLMIELKGDGCREDLADRTVALIRERGMEEQCTLASSCPELLQRVKELAPELKMVYIGMELPGEELDWVDGYSIQIDAVDREAVSRVHTQGKTICVWTLNLGREIRRALDLGVDGLVTDDPELALGLCRDFMEEGR